MERWEGDNERLIGYCIYCKRPVYENEGHVYINGLLYHFDPENYLNNCYYPERKNG
jgi:hypothetical protein